MNTQKFPLPYKGINRGVPVITVPNEYTSNINNVRPVDVLDKRIRLGKRPGLKKWSSTQVGSADQPVVALICVHSVE